MANHQTVKDLFGPGTFVDTVYTPLIPECRRLLQYFADNTPGFTVEATELDAVEFHGQDLPIIPGPLKSQAMVSISIPRYYQWLTFVADRCVSCHDWSCRQANMCFQRD